MDPLEDDVRRLATPAGREVGSPGHVAARAHLVERMRELGLEPYAGDAFELPYGARFANVLGVRRGRVAGLDPVLVAAHYDTCGPIAGADDNAAAIAIALATAAELASAPLDRDVVFAFFDAEEPPHFLGPEMGSRHFYHHQRRGRIHLALVMDLVGHATPLAGFEDLVFVTGAESDPALRAVVRDAAAEPDVRLVAALNRYVGDVSDHAVFRSDRRPYLFLSCGRWEHYHAPSDTPEKLDYRKMRAVQALLARMLRTGSAAELCGPFESADTTELEVELAERALGPYLRRSGLVLAGRRDLDAFARALLARGL